MSRLRRRRGRDVTGILLLDKPQGLTSNQALQRVKRLYGAAKAGHTGSLDPLATGMLPICFGAATKISSFLLEAGKSYRVTGRLGAATDTGDSEGRIVAEAPVPPALGPAVLESALESFRGEIEQVPPMYSALKHQGRRLYELAREGVEVERAARRVRIHSLVLARFEPPDFELEVACSKGTYVRSLVADIAAALGTAGHVTALRRSAVEPFSEAGMHELEELERIAADTEAGGAAALDALLLPIDRVFPERPRIDLSPASVHALRHGRRVPAASDWPLGHVRLYDADREFLGLGEVLAHGELVVQRVFRP